MNTLASFGVVKNYKIAVIIEEPCCFILENYRELEPLPHESGIVQSGKRFFKNLEEFKRKIMQSYGITIFHDIKRDCEHILLEDVQACTNRCKTCKSDALNPQKIKQRFEEYTKIRRKRVTIDSVSTLIKG